MQSVIVITREPLDSGQLAQTFAAAGRVNIQTGGRIVVEGDWGWFALDSEPAIADEFDRSELEAVREIIDQPYFAQLSYNRDGAADIALRLLPMPEDTLVDNDHGLRVPLAEIRRRIRRGSRWHAVAS